MHKTALERPPFALKLANFFGVFGYMSLLLEWVWVVCLVGYPLIKAGKLDWLLPESNPEHNIITPLEPASGLAIIVGVIATILCLGIMIYALYTLPRDIGKAGARLTNKAAATIVPALTHHQKISKKKIRTLTFRVSIIVKLAGAIIPLFAALVIPSTVLSHEIVLLTTVFFATWAVFHFLVQYVIVGLAKLDTDQVW